MAGTEFAISRRMIDRDDALRMKLRVRTFEAPVLSLYLRVDPGPERQRECALRARAAIDPLGVPAPIAQKVLQVVDSDRRAGTLTVFASASELEVIPLNVELPLDDAASGAVDAHWGEPYLAPLLLALEGHRRYGVILLDDRFVRMFEVFLDEIELRCAFARSPDATAATRSGELAGSRRANVRGRDPTTRDRGARQREGWRQGFYREVGRQVRSTLTQRSIGPLVLVGLDKDIAAFLAVVPEELPKRTIARLPALSRANPGPAQVLAHVSEVIRWAEDRRRDRLLDQARESGVCGVEASLQALQEGRLGTLLVAWNLDRRLQASPATGRVHAELSVATATPGAMVAPRLELPHLAWRYSTDLVFVAGAPGQRLLDELGGIAGLTRW